MQMNAFFHHFIKGGILKMLKQLKLPLHLVYHLTCLIIIEKHY